MVAPLLGLLALGAAGQMGYRDVVKPWREGREEDRLGRRRTDILSGLPEDATHDDKIGALYGAGLLSDREFAAYGGLNAQSTQDFNETLTIDAANNDAIADRTTKPNPNANVIADAAEFADTHDYGIGSVSGFPSANTATSGVGIVERPDLVGSLDAAEGAVFGNVLEAPPPSQVVMRGTPQQPIDISAVQTPQDMQAPAPYEVGSPIYYAGRAVRTTEGSNNYQARGQVVTSGQYKGERAVGAYQIMPSNLAAWSKEEYGREVSVEEFLNNPALQDDLFYRRFGKRMNEVGFANAFSEWHSGRQFEQAVRDDATDGYSTTNNHVRNTVQAYQNFAAQDTAAAQAYTPELREEVGSVDQAVNVINNALHFADNTSVGGKLSPNTAAHRDALALELETYLMPILNDKVLGGNIMTDADQELLKDWIADPTGVKLTESAKRKLQSVGLMLQNRTANTLQANGINPQLAFGTQVYGTGNWRQDVNGNPISPNDAQDALGGKVEEDLGTPQSIWGVLGLPTLGGGS